MSKRLLFVVSHLQWPQVMKEGKNMTRQDVLHSSEDTHPKEGPHPHLPVWTSFPMWYKNVPIINAFALFCLWA